MSPDALPNPDSGRSPARRPRRSGWWWLVPFAAVLGALGWQIRPEAWRQRAESGLSAAFSRPVQLGNLRVDWPDGPHLHLDNLVIPPAGDQRGLVVGAVTLFLRPDAVAWWRAWRHGRVWPITAIKLERLESAPLPPPLDDGYGRWNLGLVEILQLEASRHDARAAVVRARGGWQRWSAASAVPVIPVRGELREVALSLPEAAAPGLSMEQAALALGGLRVNLGRMVADPATATAEVDIPAMNLQSVLPALGIAVPATTDPTAFTRVAIRGTCHRDGAGMGCSEVLLGVDGSRLEGDAVRSRAVARDGQSLMLWRLRLTADRLDLDRYLPPDDPAAPPFEMPWTLADAWPVEAELAVQDLRLAGLRFRNAKVSLRAGEQGLETR